MHNHQTETDISPGILAGVRRLFPATAELRVLKWSKAKNEAVPILSGFYDNADKMAADAELADADDIGAAGVYATVNPVTAERLDAGARHDGKINLLCGRAGRGRLHRDDDIERRERIPLDIDAVKSGGSNVASTYDEHAAALSKATAVAAFLSEQEFPEPWRVVVGQRRQLVLRDRPTQHPEVRALLEGFYATLAGLFDDDRATIDTSVHNASRIMRVPGTTEPQGQAHDRASAPALCDPVGT